MRKLLLTAAAGLAVLTMTAGLAVLPAAPRAWGSADDIRAAPFAFSATYLRAADSAGEPSIALSSKDHLFICAPLGFPGGGMRFVRSENWRTFEGKTITDRTGGGDCHVAVGPDDAVYVSNLQVWASAIRKSTDDGRTFGEASEDPVEQDRQWLAVDPADPAVVYQVYHDWTVSAIVVAKSVDGGATWLLHSLVSTDPLLLADQGRASTPGPIRVDPTNHLRLYTVWSSSSLATCAGAPGTCTPDLEACPSATQACLPRRGRHRLVVGRSEDGGLTWTNHVAMTAPAGSDIGQLIPWISVDRAGNVYVVAGGNIADRNGLWMAASTDRGETWTGPVKVDDGEGAVVFPTVAAGAGGIADFTWLQSTASSPDDPSGEWRIRFAQSRDATAASPTFSLVTGPVVHRGDICTLGIGCILGGNRVLLDFMDMALDRFGYAHIVTATTLQGDPPVAGGLRTLYWRQDAGPSALSEPCAQAGDPDCVTVRPGPLP